MQWNKNKKKILQKPYYVLIINKWEEIINKLKFGAIYIYKYKYIYIYIYIHIYMYIYFGNDSTI